ncbi:flagellar hook-associated protein 1 FlgK [Melghiribacillus thermohalophilus]|uniref:Flagellar hook-associated protein 1 n=1 Tax=Melghiribacillus thermohalophilus TaxID=1324956 RepID=A0A4V2V1B1_9BACI|nr:flagellar hook-associated protein FlgK [Melghiribacillus thermohalophilus]TCT20452.1 flagellar hook-associated protein 1 FlgK [Melghiribacillus thermohalophilus]
MTSTFFGFEIARRALFAQQTAIHTTSHNIANASTPGYSRQRVNFQQTSPYPAPGRTRPEIPGQMGTGVEVGSIQRIRDQFLDIQYRNENNKFGYWEARSAALEQMEEIMNEPSEYGLSKTLDRFWQSLQDLSANPEDSGARSVALERGVAVAESFNYLSSSLKAVQDDLKNEIDVTVDKINSLLTQIDGINKQISEVEPHGYVTNDLYDERDRLIDELSSLVNIEVDYSDSGGNSSDIAMGLAEITLADEGIVLVSNDMSNPDRVNEFSIDTTGLVTDIDIGTTTLNFASDFQSSGKLKGLIESYGYIDTSGNEAGLYPERLQSLDIMAYNFADAFNARHNLGTDLNGNPGVDFFNLAGPADAAANIEVNPALTEDGIAASLNGDAGNGENAIELAKVIEEEELPGLGNATVKNYYESIIGEMAVQAQEANRMMNNAETLQLAAEKRRQSVSAVSLDEEMTNLIRFQHAYNAAARNITTIDEMLDRIINNMGLVGR